MAVPKPPDGQEILLKKIRDDLEQLIPAVREIVQRCGEGEKLDKQDEDGRVESTGNSPYVWKNHCVIDLSRPEEKPLFFLRYNTIKNVYTSSVDSFQRKDWSSLLFSSENLDWNRDLAIRYVSRYSACKPATVGKAIWRFDLSNYDDWKRLEVKVAGRIHMDTSIRLNFIAYNKCDDKQSGTIELELNTPNIVQASQFKFQVGVLDLVAELEGDKKPGDELNWRRPQLLYQNKRMDDDYSLVFEIY